MAPTITLSDETFSKLQALAKPFVDTPESVISALAEAELGRRGPTGNGNSRAEVRSNSMLKLSPDAHENLTHTRILSAKIDGRPLHRPKWNGMLDQIHVLGRERLGPSRRFAMRPVPIYVKGGTRKTATSIFPRQIYRSRELTQISRGITLWASHGHLRYQSNSGLNGATRKVLLIQARKPYWNGLQTTDRTRREKPRRWFPNHRVGCAEKRSASFK